MLRAALKPVRDRVYEICRWVSTHTMLRAALKHVPIPIELAGRSGLDTHNAACGIDSKTALRVLSVTQSRFVCKNRTAILTMRRTDVSIEIQKGTA